MSLTTKYWLSLVVMIVSGIVVIQLYAPVLNGIQSANAVTTTLFIVSIVVFVSSAISYYYLKSARKYQTTGKGDLSILENTTSNTSPSYNNLTKKK